MIDFNKVDIIKIANKNVLQIQDKKGTILWENFDNYIRGTTNGSTFKSSFGSTQYAFKDSVLHFKLKYSGSTLTTLRDTFNGISEITKINHWGIDTKNVTNMEGTFKDCTNITSINFHNWNTSSVTNMRGMFNGCTSLSDLDLSSFSTSNSESFTNFVKDCSNLKTLDLSIFNMAKINKATGVGTYMFEMFKGCSSLTTVKVTNCNDDTTNKILERLKHDLSSYTWILSNGIITRENK